MSRRLAMKRFSRSDSSMIVPTSSAFALSLSASAKVPQSPGGAEDCRQGRPEIVRYRGEQRRAQPIGLGGELGAARCPRRGAPARSRAQPDPRVRQTAGAAPGVSSGPGLSLSIPTTPTAPRPVRMRQEQALGTGQRVGSAAGRPVVLPGPFRRSDVSLVQHVFGRIAGSAPRSSRRRAGAARPAR